MTIASTTVALHTTQTTHGGGAPSVKARAKTLPRPSVQRFGSSGKALFRAALLASGTSQSAVATAWGVNDSVVSRKLSDDDNAEPTITNLLTAPPAVLSAFVEIVPTAERRAAGLPDTHHMMLVSRELGELCAVVVETGADGHESLADLKRKMAELADLRAAVNAAICDVAARMENAK
jgi:hypothetical protein